MKATLKITHELQAAEGFMDYIKTEFEEFELKEKGEDYDTFTVSHPLIQDEEICPIIGYNKDGSYKIIRW